jgi:DNA-binding response OmpR family regulator
MANEIILVVDDNPEIVRFLKQYVLVPAGYHVLTASDGQNGLELAIQSRPDLIMLDMTMPRLSGIEMLISLRKSAFQCPVIFMTVHGSENIAVEAFRLGVRDYMIKPFTVDEVRQAVDRALNEVRLAREKEELSRNLLASETVQQTVITLAHYINNHLTVLTAGMSILQEAIERPTEDNQLQKTVARDCQSSLKQIQAVMRVLTQVTHVHQASYHGQVKMIDIETELKKEMGNGQP